MFERFTGRARQVVVLAQEEARALKHDYIGSEHILLGLLGEEEGLAARVLESLDIPVERARAQVVRIVGSGEQVTSGQMPFTTAGKRVLELALREAVALGHNYIGTEHILLGLLRENEGVAARVLFDFEAEAHHLRERVLSALDDAPDEGSPPRGIPAANPPRERLADAELGERVGRHGGSETSAPAPATGMFERFTERPRQVVVLAQEEARGLRHDYIGTEHILLGLLREGEGLGARVLESLEVTLAEARAGVVGRVGAGERLVSGQFPFTPRAKKVLELALREALSLGHNYIRTEHILLALVREGEGVAHHVLAGFGADSEKVRNEVIRMLSGARPRWHPSGEGVAQGASRDAALERIGLSDEVLDGAGPALWSLAAEIEQRLGRAADAGDLLLLLSSVPNGLAARVLATLGVCDERLVRAVDEARRDEVRSALLPPAELLPERGKLRTEKEAAMERQDFDRATELRERERELLNKARAAVEAQQDQMLADIRKRLGLTAE